MVIRLHQKNQCYCQMVNNAPVSILATLLRKENQSTRKCVESVKDKLTT